MKNKIKNLVFGIGFLYSVFVEIYDLFFSYCSKEVNRAISCDNGSVLPILMQLPLIFYVIFFIIYLYKFFTKKKTNAIEFILFFILAVHVGWSLLSLCLSLIIPSSKF